MTNLLHYRPSSVFDGGVKLGSRVIPQSLETTARTTAKLRLGGFLRGRRRRAILPMAATFTGACASFEADQIQNRFA